MLKVLIVWDGDEVKNIWKWRKDLLIRWAMHDV